MKIAVLSDIHSNVFALEAVTHDIKKHNVDVTVNLGDILYGPIAPRATYDLLMENEFVTIRGNQDRQIYEATPPELPTNIKRLLRKRKVRIDQTGHKSFVQAGPK